MDTAYVTGEEAFLTANPAIRSRLLGWLYTNLLPTDRRRGDQIWCGCTRAIRPPSWPTSERFVRQWLAVRALLSPTSVATHPTAALAADLSADYLPLGQHLDRLFLVEQAEGQADQAEARPPTRSG